MRPLNTIIPVSIAEYKLVNGTSYRAHTPARVCEILEYSRLMKKTLAIYYGSIGDEATMVIPWGNSPEVGVVSRIEGSVKVPCLLRARGRAWGNGVILDDRIIQIGVAPVVADMHEIRLWKHPLL